MNPFSPPPQARAASARISPWLQKFARFGYAAKGATYLVIGVLAVRAALGAGGETTDSQGALREIASGPFGSTLLALTALGLLGYALWKLIQAIRDPENEGADARGSVKRAAYGISGLVHLGLAATAIQMAFFAGAGGSGDASAQSGTAWLLGQPFGRWLVGLVGAAVIGVGFVQLGKAWTAKFRRKLKLGEMSAAEETWATRVGRCGFAARGVVFGLIGWFLLRAAWQADASEAGGLSQALQTLAEHPSGPWLLGLTAAGLAAYGVFALVMARYRELHLR